MKYKIRYTLMTLVFCGLLGWDLTYEYNKVDVTVPPHPIVHTVQHLIAPNPPKPVVPAVKVPVTVPMPEASSTNATSTPTTASSTPPRIATSTPPRRGRPAPVPIRVPIGIGRK